MDAEVELDINGEQGFNAQDAVIMYYALSFPEVLGGTLGTPGYELTRRELFDDVTGQSNPTSGTLLGFLQTARQLAREHRNSKLDINGDGRVHADDALIMYYVYSLPELVGNQEGEVANTIWQTFLTPLRSTRYPSNRNLQPLIEQANALNYK